MSPSLSELLDLIDAMGTVYQGGMEAAKAYCEANFPGVDITRLNAAMLARAKALAAQVRAGQ